MAEPVSGKRFGELPKRSWDAFAEEMRKEIADDKNK
jgi:hypothetical protein